MSQSNVVTLPTPPLSNYPRLDPKPWKAKLIAFRALKAERQDADRQTRVLKKLGDGARDQIVEAMAGAPVAQCGDLMVTVKENENVAACITLRNGRKINPSDIKTIVLRDGSKVNDIDIVSLYGGRSGSTDVEIIG